MWCKIRTVWMRELLDTVRDRRTLFTMVLLPIILMPVMLSIGPIVMMREEEEAREAVPVASVIGGEHVADLVAQMERDGRWEVQSIPVGGNDAELEKRLEEGEFDLVVYVGENAAERLADEQPVSVEVAYAMGKNRSVQALERFEFLLNAYGDDLVSARLEARGLAPELIRPFEITERRNVTPDRDFIAQMLGMMVPMFVVMWGVVGGMYVAVDSGAGEKERNSLESLLMAPVPAAALAIGKLLAVATVSFGTVLLMIGSILGSFLYLLPRLLGGTEALTFRLSPTGALLMMAMMALFVTFTSSVLLGLSVYSKSPREAQAYTSALMFAAMLPGMYLAFVQELKAALWLYFVPVINVLLVTRELFEGIPGVAALAATFVSLAVVAAGALWLTLRAFRDERVLFRV